MSTNHYFERIGAWPHHSARIERTYVYGFVLSLTFTVGAYALVVQHLVSAFVAIPLILILACLQVLVQVLNFLHVSGAASSRERLVALACTGIIMLILVLGSMWIMTNLETRMMPAQENMETYMQREQGI